ncbi:MAG: aldose 1-epimerase family protein [Planctomycetales bacterium]|nr:aldose 1-epimerase family protein [Planctomycetales bacterium]
MRCVLCMLLVVLSTRASAKGPLEFVLTDAEANINLPGFEKSSRDFPAMQTGPWRIEKRVLHGGKQEGSELIVVNNGALQFGVSPTRGMNVVYLKHIGGEEFPVGWKSPVSEVVNPTFIDLESRGGLGWLDGFNEWMCRCGLEFAGHPGKDVFITNTGDKGELTLTLHGKVGNTPASRVVVAIDQDPPYRLRVQGTVFERSFHGPKLRLETEISTVPGSLSVQVNDSVTNLGGNEQEFQLIYHTNYGNPILEKNARVIGAFHDLQPMNEHAAKSVKTWDVYDAPAKDFIEQVYLAEAASDAHGKTSILLVNSQGTKGASITWNVAELPYVTIWKNTAAEADGYVTGLEPGTGFPFNRWVERQFDRVPKLQPGQTRQFALSYGIHPDAQSVTTIRQRIEAIQQQQPLSVTPAAPEIPEFPEDEVD